MTTDLLDVVEEGGTVIFRRSGIDSRERERAEQRQRELRLNRKAGTMNVARLFDSRATLANGRAVLAGSLNHPEAQALAETQLWMSSKAAQISKQTKAYAQTITADHLPIKSASTISREKKAVREFFKFEEKDQYMAKQNYRTLARQRRVNIDAVSEAAVGVAEYEKAMRAGQPLKAHFELDTKSKTIKQEGPGPYRGPLWPARFPGKKKQQHKP